MEVENWIQTYTGIKFNLTSPTADMIDIVDIAHALSQQCRFTGHTKHFFSVAEHCINCAAQADDPQHAMALLLHDAPEAYIGDVNSPLKALIADLYRPIDERVATVIYEKFGADRSPEMRARIRVVDLRMLETERRLLMGDPPDRWFCESLEPYDVPLTCYNVAKAKKLYLETFEVLKGKV